MEVNAATIDRLNEAMELLAMALYSLPPDEAEALLARVEEGTRLIMAEWREEAA